MKTLKPSPFLLILGISASVIFFVTACSKERIEKKATNSYNSPNSYLDSKKQDEQEFVIDSTGSGPIIGNQGTKIWTGKDCLMFPNGDSVTYPFTVKLVELYTAKDMIYYQMPTVAGGNILETDGEIRLRAFKNGTELLLRPGCSAQIEMPNTAPKNYMHVFYGFNSSNYVDWTDNLISLGVTTSLNPLFSVTSYGYMGQIGRLGWINCGANAGSNPSSVLTFTSSVDDLTNVGIFIYFPSTKSLMQVYNTVSGQIPNGSNVKIIALGLDSNNQLFSFNQNVTVNSNSEISVTLTATTDADFTSLLDSL